MKTALFVIALLMPAAARADDITIDVDNFYLDRGISSAVLKVTNKSNRDYNRIFIDCVFMDKDERAIDIGKAMITGLPSGASSYDKASIPTTDGVQYVACSVKRAS